MDNHKSKSVKTAWQTLKIKGKLSPYMICCLAGKDYGSFNDWNSPKMIRKELKSPFGLYPSRSGITKELERLKEGGIVERRYLPPKQYRLRGKPSELWGSFSEKKKSTFHKGEWRLTHTKAAFKEQLKIVLGSPGCLESFLKSAYYEQNKNLIFFMLNKTFQLGEELPKTKEELINIFTDSEKNIVSLASKSPTLLKLICDENRAGKLAEWFTKNISPNALDYMRFVVVSCLVVDSFKQDEDITPTTEEKNIIPIIEKQMCLLLPSLNYLNLNKRKKSFSLHSPEYKEKLEKLKKEEE